MGKFSVTGLFHLPSNTLAAADTTVNTEINAAHGSPHAPGKSSFAAASPPAYHYKGKVTASNLQRAWFAGGSSAVLPDSAASTRNSPSSPGKKRSDGSLKHFGGRFFDRLHRHKSSDSLKSNAEQQSAPSNGNISQQRFHSKNIAQRPLQYEQPDDGANLRQFEAFSQSVMDDMLASPAYADFRKSTGKAGKRVKEKDFPLYQEFSTSSLVPLVYQKYTHNTNFVIDTDTPERYLGTISALDSLKYEGLTVRSQSRVALKTSNSVETVGPAAYFLENPAAAIASNYFVMTNEAASDPDATIPLLSSRGIVEPRYSVGIEAGKQDDLIRLLPDILHHFGTRIDSVKVTAPDSQGVRPDGLIFYFTKPDENQVLAHELSRFLHKRLPDASWRQPPAGMLQIRNESGAIGAYGENYTNSAYDTGFGKRCSRLISQAIVASLAGAKNDVALARSCLPQELRAAFKAAGYNPDCPALIDRADLAGTQIDNRILAGF